MASEEAVWSKYILFAIHFVHLKAKPAQGNLIDWQSLVVVLNKFILQDKDHIFIFRLFHHPRLYKHIHKIHHEWTAPTSIVSIYAHPLEHVVSNLLPVALGPIIMGSHLATAWLWFSLALMSTTVAHSGYHLPLFPSPEAHDYHHLK